MTPVWTDPRTLVVSHLHLPFSVGVLAPVSDKEILPFSVTPKPSQAQWEQAKSPYPAPLPPMGLSHVLASSPPQGPSGARLVFPLASLPRLEPRTTHSQCLG